MKLTYQEQQELFIAGAIIESQESGICKKILKGNILHGVVDCLGFRNTAGTWFYGASYFRDDEELTVLYED